MENYKVKTQGICSREIDFSIEDGKLYNVHFIGGCPGNTTAIGKLLEGTSAQISWREVSKKHWKRSVKTRK